MLLPTMTCHLAAARLRPGIGYGRLVARAFAAAWLLAATLETASAAPPAGPPAPAPRVLVERLPPTVRPFAARDGLVWKRPGGDAIVELVEDAPLGPPRPGLAVLDGSSFEIEYTLDPALDAWVRAMLARADVVYAHVIVMDPRSGEVLAYVSTDPEGFPATRLYPTASLMKVVTAAAALRADPAVAGASCRYLGSPYIVQASHLEPPAAGGRVHSFLGALAASNNQCFARLAVHAVGRDPLLEELERTGMLSSPAPLHAPGRVDPVSGPLELALLGSGLRGSYVTPLAAARLAAALAHGERVEPRWIRRVTDAEGRALALPPSAPRRPVWPASLARTLRELMVGVTERGTARRAFQAPDGSSRLGPIQVAGKTGTLSGDDPAGLYQWFMGVAPAASPELAVTALTVDGTVSASEVAAAVFEQVFCGGEGVCTEERLDALQARAAAREGAFEAAAEASAREAPRSDLDETPRPVAFEPLDFPRALRLEPVEGEVVLRLTLAPDGRVARAEVERSDLPAFDTFVRDSVSEWRFTPPRRDGEPVDASVRLPVPIRIR